MPSYEVWAWTAGKYGVDPQPVLIGEVELEYPYFVRWGERTAVVSSPALIQVTRVVKPLIERAYSLPVRRKLGRSRTMFDAIWAASALANFHDSRFKKKFSIPRWSIEAELLPPQGTGEVDDDGEPVLYVGAFVQPKTTELYREGKNRFYTVPGSVEQDTALQTRVYYPTTGEREEMRHSKTLDLTKLVEQHPELTVKLDELLERGLAGVKSHTVDERSGYITFDKVRVQPEESFRRRYGGRAVNKKLSFSMQRAYHASGRNRFFGIDGLNWYATPELTRRLRQLATSDVPVGIVNNSKEYLLKPEDRMAFSIWLDQLAEVGLLPSGYDDEGKVTFSGYVEDDVLVLTEGVDYELDINNRDSVGWLGRSTEPSQLHLKPVSQTTPPAPEYRAFFITLDRVERPHHSARPQWVQPYRLTNTGFRVDLIASTPALIGGKSLEDWSTQAHVQVRLTEAGRQQLSVFSDMLLERGQ